MRLSYELHLFVRDSYQTMGEGIFTATWQMLNYLSVSFDRQLQKRVVKIVSEKRMTTGCITCTISRNTFEGYNYTITDTKVLQQLDKKTQESL